jgi:hypothetical protein
MPKRIKSKINLPQRATRAAFVPASINEEDRTIEIVWTTGAEGERCEWDGEVYLESLRVDDASVRMGRLNSGAPVLDAHQSWELRNQIGVVEKAWLVDGVGHALVRFSAREEVEPFFQDVKAGIIRNISVGYVVYHYERVAGEDGSPDRMIAVDWEPLELSFVPVPFDAGAQVRGGVTPRTFTADVTNRTKGNPKMPRELKVIRAALVQARDTLAKAREVEDETKIAEAQTILAAVEDELEQALDALDEGLGDGSEEAAPDAETVTKSADEDPEQRGIKSERQRQVSIRALGQRFKADAVTVEALIERGLTVDQAKLSILATLAERQAGINTHAGANVPQKNIEKARSHIEAAILHRAAPGKHKLPEEARGFRGLTLMDMARECIEMAGGNVRGMDRHQIARLSLNIGGHSAQRAAGMHSTSDFPLILGNTINRSLRAAYDEVAQTWLPLGRQANFADFRARMSVALGEASRLEIVKEGGEYKYGTLPEDGSSIKAEKWGKIIALTWEAIINDDLNAFDKIPTALANSARQTESNVIWDLFIKDVKYSDGVNIFNSAHGNLAGTAAAITVESLAAARASMRKQKGLDKTTFINVTPKYLVVGPDKELEAYQFTSPNYFPVTAGTINPTPNTQLTVIVEPRITGNQWFLVGDGETFEYGYLDGEGGLMTDTREGFEVDGLEVKARLVFGAGWVDYRAAYKNAGA